MMPIIGPALLGAEECRVEWEVEGHPQALCGAPKDAGRDEEVAPPDNDGMVKVVHIPDFNSDNPQHLTLNTLNTTP